MSPLNPGRYKLDEDDRLQIPKASLPPWLESPSSEEELFCVPIRWRRTASLLPRHELHAWCLWGAKAGGKWNISPEDIIKRADKDPVQFALRSLMYPARYNSKGRLSCAEIFNLMTERTGIREFWVAPEADTVSIWPDAAFQVS